MKSRIKQYILLGAVMSLALGQFSMKAQETKSGYFVNNYTYGYRLNPAMGLDRSFFSIPALGNIGVGMTGNLSLTDVIYNVNGKTTTFLNPGISAAEVMGNLKDVNKTNVQVNVNVLSFGFKAFGVIIPSPSMAVPM